MFWRSTSSDRSLYLYTNVRTIGGTNDCNTVSTASLSHGCIGHATKWQDARRLGIGRIRLRGEVGRKRCICLVHVVRTGESRNSPVPRVHSLNTRIVSIVPSPVNTNKSNASRSAQPCPVLHCPPSRRQDSSPPRTPGLCARASSPRVCPCEPPKPSASCLCYH